MNVIAVVQGGRAGLDLRDAVSGSTFGRLRLSQFLTTTTRQVGAIRGLLGEGPVRTRLLAENLGGGDLEILVDAKAGGLRGGRPPGHSDITIGDVRGVSNAGANVDIEVRVVGFRVIQEQLDAPGSLSHIEGVSNGGDVSVAGDFRSGNGQLLTTLVGTDLIAESGPSIAIEDAVGGETSGHLTLLQDVRAGAGLDLNPTPVFPPIDADAYFAGHGGDAINRISEAGSFESLTMTAESLSGIGGVGSFLGEGGNSGSALSILDGVNDAGSVTLVGYARSFPGGSSTVRTGDGGDVAVDLRATTSGDGHSILIGGERQNESEFIPGVGLVSKRHGADAGNAGDAPQFGGGGPPEFGRGGNADSHVEGLAHGDSEVLVYGYAFAGRSDGLGGDAVSSARAEGGGLARVLAESTARGGIGIERAGDSRSSAHAIGFGEVEANAFARAGSGGLTPTTKATSIVDLLGDSGNAIAEADAQTSPGGNFRASIHRATSNAARFEVIVGDGVEISATPNTNAGSAYLTGTPLPADVATFTSGNMAIAEIFASTPTARVAALGQWSARGDEVGSSTQFVELDIRLSPPDDQSQLALVFSEVDASGGGFESLRFRLEVFGELLGEEMVFSDLDDATTYLSSVFLLGQAFLGQGTGTPIRALFEVTIGAGQSVRYGLAAVVVPEPSAALMIGLGLLVLVSSKKRAAFAA